MKIGCSFISLLLSITLNAQNLIPNPGFEDVSGCPGADVNLKNTAFWQRIDNHFGTPDQFFGDCPYNGLVNKMAPGQLPYDGQGYIGFFCYGDNLREYATVQLSTPMVRDSVYEITFYVLPATGYGTIIDGIGAHFSTIAVKGEDAKSLGALTLNEHVGNPAGSLITDTINWTRISGKYKASGGEQFATFGNFRKDAQTKSLMIKENSIRCDRSYLLLDGIEVKLADERHESKNDVNTIVQKDTSLIHDRKVRVSNTFITAHQTITLQIWDHMKNDKDTIVLMLNDSILLDHHRLRRLKTKIELDLDPGEYLLKLVAVNLGEIPPNTAAIRVSDDQHTKVFILSSDLKVTECLRIIVD